MSSVSNNHRGSRMGSGVEMEVDQSPHLQALPVSCWVERRSESPWREVNQQWEMQSGMRLT